MSFALVQIFSACLPGCLSPFPDDFRCRQSEITSVQSNLLQYSPRPSQPLTILKTQVPLPYLVPEKCAAEAVVCPPNPPLQG